MRVFRDLLDTFFRHGSLICVATGVATAALGLSVFLSPRTYEASARIYLKGERAPISPIAQDVVTSGNVELNDVQIATEMELMTSASVLQAAAKQWGEAADDNESVQARIEQIKKRLKIAPVMRSSIIELKYADVDPQRAARVLNAITGEYLQRHLTLRGGTTNFEFFARKAEESRVNLQKAQAALAQFQAGNRIFALADQKQQAMKGLADSASAIHEAEASQAELENRLVTLRRQLQSETPRIATSERSVPDHYSAERLTTLLVELGNKRTELTSKFRADDRLVLQLNKQIEDTSVALANALSRTSREQTTDINPVRQQAALDLARTEQALQGARARTAILRRQNADYQSTLWKLTSATPKEAELARKVAEAEYNYGVDVKKRDAFRVDSLLDNNKITNVQLLEPATAPSRPRPRVTTPVIALLVLLNGVIVFCIIVAGYLKPTFSTPQQLERFTGVSVIATVPGRVKQRRQIVKPAFLQPIVETIRARAASSNGSKIFWFVRVGPPDAHAEVLPHVAAQLSAAARRSVLSIPSSVATLLDSSQQWPELALQQTAAGVMEAVPLDRLEQEEDSSLDWIWLGVRPTEFTHIVIETPLNTGAPLPPGLHHADEIFLVVTAGKSRRTDINEAIRALGSAGRQPSGFVLANRTYPIPEAIYQYL